MYRNRNLDNYENVCENTFNTINTKAGEPKEKKKEVFTPLLCSRLKTKKEETPLFILIQIIVQK